MGQRLTSNFRRPDETVQTVDISNENAYRWPPKTGTYVDDVIVDSLVAFSLNYILSFAPSFVHPLTDIT